MVKLYAFALLMISGFDIKLEYEKYLDKQFICNPDNYILLDLEFISNDIDKTSSYIKETIDYNIIDYNQLAKEVVKNMKICYETMAFNDFISKTYLLWQSLPYELAHNEPFYELRFADDPYSYGVNVESKQIIEDILDFYNH